ncbi:MAG: TetR family transcriptional regulator [Myxococcales bacterium]|nr:MAG: TetR family transcriptional regulator [Myxococcales bacterium]
MEKETSRDRLTAAAFALFAEQGYDATTVDEIAARAGVGRTTYFRNFRTKEDVVFPEHEDLLAAIEGRLAAATKGNSLVAIVDAARLVLRHYLDEGDLARSRYALTSAVPALRDREIASAQRYRLKFKRFILGWLGDEPRAELQADLMAAAVVTAHNHVLRRWLREQTSTPEAEFDEAMAEVSAIYGRRSSSEETTVVVLRSSSDVEALLPRIREALERD